MDFSANPEMENHSERTPNLPSPVFKIGPLKRMEMGKGWVERESKRKLYSFLNITPDTPWKDSECLVKSGA